jgi:hypothetical protein
MNAGTTTERPAVAVGRGGGGGRRWRVALAVIVVVAIVAAASAVAGVLNGTGAPGAGVAGAFKTATALVARRTLVSRTQLSATLADAGSYSVVNQASGTLTRLPAVGKVVRQGHALYQVDAAARDGHLGPAEQRHSASGRARGRGPW